MDASSSPHEGHTAPRNPDPPQYFTSWSWISRPSGSVKYSSGVPSFAPPRFSMRSVTYDVNGAAGPGVLPRGLIPYPSSVLRIRSGLNPSRFIHRRLMLAGRGGAALAPPRPAPAPPANMRN